MGARELRGLCYKQLNIMRPGLFAPVEAEVFLLGGQGATSGHSILPVLVPAQCTHQSLSHDPPRALIDMVVLVLQGREQRP